MHIADGIIATEIAIAADVFSAGVLFIFGKKIPTDDVPKMGLMAAALFVISLVHFPIAGTSMHLGLFGLAGILLGWGAFPVIFIALLFQSLIFQHGGLMSLGLNAVNMGAGAVAGYLIWKMCGFPEKVRAFLAGFFGILIAAFLMALEFQLSGYGKGIFYILYAYVLVAGIEGVLTASVIGFFRRVDPAIFKK
jgi:cobalt/nickel transport system permease protein